MTPFTIRAGRRIWITGAVAALAAGCASSGTPAAPVDVRVTEMSPELVDRIASLVADQVGRELTTRGPGVRRDWAPPAASSPPVRATPLRRATPPRAAAPAPTPTDADMKSLSDGIALSLEWLAAHQSESGAWSSAGFHSHCKLNRCSGPGEAAYDTGVTGLALLCFLGAGESHTSGPHTETVKRGLRYLRSAQDPEGCIGTRTSAHFLYNHAYGALALVEAYGLTRSPTLRTPAQQAVNFILQARNPYLGWRYGIRDGDNDTSVTGLMVLVLRAAKTADLEVDAAAFAGARSWIDKMTEPEFGKIGYQQRGGPTARTSEMQSKFPADRSEAMTAVGTAARIFAGDAVATSDLVPRSVALMAARPPVWNETDGSIDLYYWYWGTLAMSQVGGPQWEQWRAHLVRALPGNQRREPGRDERGSWDPVDPWSAEGGRIYTTAMACLASEIVSRAAPR